MFHSRPDVIIDSSRRRVMLDHRSKKAPIPVGQKLGRLSLQINIVWIGPGALSPVSLFNIYSWLAVGCHVTIYTFHPAGKHNLRTLGLESRLVNVIDLATLLHTDDEHSWGNALPTAYIRVPNVVSLTPYIRATILSWFHSYIEGYRKDPRFNRGLVYSVADLCKSYIGGTRRGIVLDPKIGPSENIKKYIMANIFDRYFISFARGGKVKGVENQCMGSMAMTDTLHKEYINFIEARIKPQFLSFCRDPENNFDQITILHARAFTKCQPHLDVTDKKHIQRTGVMDVAFDEIGIEKNKGPFRVFKLWGDQTNDGSSTKTTDIQVWELCIKVLHLSQYLVLPQYREFDRLRRVVLSRWLPKINTLRRRQASFRRGIENWRSKHSRATPPGPPGPPPPPCPGPPGPPPPPCPGPP